MKNIMLRQRFVKIYSYVRFNAVVKKKGYLELQKFMCSKAPSLEKFFKEDVNSSISIYIVYDTNAKIIVGYYTLMPSCMIREYEEKDISVSDNREIEVQKSIPCLEIEKFAVNERYLDWLEKKGYNNRGVGYFIFKKYIIKTIIYLSGYMNFSFIILHAISESKVIEAYRNMGFETFEDDETNIVSLLDGVSSIKEAYVNGCKFMYQPMEQIVNEIWKGGN